MNDGDYFSPDYVTARARFRAAATALGWQLEAHPIAASCAQASELTIDVAISPSQRDDQALILSSGVHGPEGFFGSAVQLGLLKRWRAGSAPPPSTRVIMLHGLNPYGFAAGRRFNEDNIDLNRNFLLPDESYSGAPAKYADLDRLLNPASAPARLDLFPLQALGAIARFGLPALMQAIAAGQYEYPRGLFFGGRAPGETHTILLHQLPRWLSHTQEVVHLDFHTGLGRHGTHKLLIDYPLTDRQRQQLTEWFGADTFMAHEADDRSYAARGGFGQWCVGHAFAPHYLFATAEFGTYPPTKMLAGLRLENQAHHFGDPAAPLTQQIKQRLRELFCPAALAWRKHVLVESYQLVQRAIDGLESERTIAKDSPRAQ